MIRKATAADAPAVARVHVLSSRETYAGLLPEAHLARFTVESRTAMWSEVLGAAVDRTVVYVAEPAGEVVGFGAFGPQRAVALRDRGFDAEILCLYLLRQFQRRGLGRGLMRRMADDLRQRGFRGVSLWVHQENPVARTFYERLGGRIVDEMTTATQPVRTEVAYAWSDLGALSAAAPR
jgi:ribosomal protein S18 acetylase RimI-like enzyme